MKFLHTSDWHLGRTFHGADLLGDQEVFLRWLLAAAVEHAVDAVLVAGDVYDRAVPPPEAVALLDRTLDAFVAARIPVVLVPGNHDSAIRLGFGRMRSEVAGLHVRASIADIDRPVLLRDDAGPVAVYGIPFLLPDACRVELAAERSHTAVLTAAMDRIHTDRLTAGHQRTVVVAHAFVTGGAVSESERDIRVGGIGDVPATVFAGVQYVALGHLHGPQTLTTAQSAGAPVVRYSGSPLAFSFGERNHHKSVTLVDLDAAGAVTFEALPVPVPRPLFEVRGTLEDLLARADRDLSHVGDGWVKAVLTDARRPDVPMERLRGVWPHTIVLDFQPGGERVDPDAALARLATETDPVQIALMFLAHVGGGDATDEEQAIIRDAVEAVNAVAVSA